MSKQYTTCRCGALLTEQYAERFDDKCDACRRDLSSKLYWAFAGPGSATYNL